MTSKQRAYLRGMANNMEPIFQIGKAGITNEIIKQLSDALEARELIKITTLKNAPDYAKEFATEISKKTNSDVIQVIGNKIVLYRKNEKKNRYEM